MAQACYDAFNFDPFSKYWGSCRFITKKCAAQEVINRASIYVFKERCEPKQKFFAKPVEKTPLAPAGGDNGEKQDHKVREEHRAISEEIEKTQNANFCSRVRLLSPLLPPSTDVDVAKALL
uniref:Uncharacterized protein n=1 Tax=Vitis vinifera TaxID=29760 RepID=A5CAZ1_VITVI|nr:hypothetical protein VITISV_002538 [Vitis vinifera]